MENILQFKNVNYSYSKDNLILKDIDVSFEKGKFYTIVGQSGSGKTTFISLACGLDKQDSGDIIYKGEKLKSIGLEKFRNQHVSIIFQGYNLLNYMTALENVTSAMSIKNITTENNKQFALDMLQKVGIDNDKAKQKTLTLSGGQQQRVAIARALCCQTDLIIADEPTGNLDENTSNEIIDIFKDIVKNEGKTILMVTHNKEIAMESDEVYLVKNKNLIKADKDKL